MTSTTLPNTDNLRYADLKRLNEVLSSQRTRAFDVVAGAQSFRFTDDAQLQLSGIAEPVLFDDGVTDVNGLYDPTSVADEGFSEKLNLPAGIPIKFLRQARNTMPDLYASVLNRVLRDEKRTFLLRFLRSDDQHQGLLRAFLSDQYKTIDNIDVLLAVLEGIRGAGVDPRRMVIDADLTERRMVVRVSVPEIAVYAPEFLKNYRNPFDGSSVARGWVPDQLRQAADREGHKVTDEVVFAGFVFTNSETGDGAYTLTPRLTVGVCTNGLQLTADGIRKAHLGGKLGEGVVRWSKETQQANLALIVTQAADTVRTFLDKEYVTAQVEKLTKKATEKIGAAPQEVIARVSKQAGFTEAQRDIILAHFIQGGQLTTGGVMQAVTSASQVIQDGDTAFEMEAAALRCLDFAHQANRDLVKAGK
jgi:hypothetical protein